MNIKNSLFSDLPDVHPLLERQCGQSGTLYFVDSSRSVDPTTMIVSVTITYSTFPRNHPEHKNPIHHSARKELFKISN